jgi:vanillate O-demethylase ferredoxin subunit
VNSAANGEQLDNSATPIEVVVSAVMCEAEGVNVYELKPLYSSALPAFSAGAHIDIYLPNGLVRPYSLCNDEGDRKRYSIAVSLDRNSSGGSRYMHECVRAGDRLRISRPRNNFPLVEHALHTVLVAGGIGITPIWCMLQRLVRLGRSWTLYYCARTRREAAFVAAIESIRSSDPTAVRFNFDKEAGGVVLDLASVLEPARQATHYYCCGPTPMLESFKQATAGISPECVHVEYFSASNERATEGGFTVVLARSGRTVRVTSGKSILQALLDEGIHVPHSCTEGTCGTCETVVLHGTPDHRDSILSDSEHASNETMMICCSGCIGEEIVLDL